MFISTKIGSRVMVLGLNETSRLQEGHLNIKNVRVDSPYLRSKL